MNYNIATTSYGVSGREVLEKLGRLISRHGKPMNFLTEVMFNGWVFFLVLVVTATLVVVFEIQREKDLETRCSTCGGDDLKRSSRPSWLTQKSNEYFCYNCQRYFSKP